MAKITYKCPYCGSHDVTMDATAKWNDELQKWIHSDTSNGITCQDCLNEDYPERFCVTL